MTIKELKDIIKDIPEDAVVYIEADHGQSPEQAGIIEVTADIDLPPNGDEVAWRNIGKVSLVTAILIR